MKTETAFTPGPPQSLTPSHFKGEWKAKQYGNTIIIVAPIDGSTERYIAHIGMASDWLSSQIDLANARLIAEAPAMFEALTELLADTECYCADNVADRNPCPVHKAEAILQRIGGQQ